jgi:gliding motility-associated-like protein
VVVEVICADSLKAFNAISPNGDGRNDAFRIEGLQKYPNNTLLIFNRWGNEVLNVKKYQNDWQGTWNSKDLPDGTYFYLLRDEDTNEVILTGYLQILR